MPYSNATQVRSRASVALSPSSEPARYDAAITAGIEWADGWIDGRLRSKFEDQIPFASPPVLIQGISADLAASFVLKQAFAGGGESKIPTLAQDLFDRAELALDRLLSGDMALPSTAGQATGPSMGVYSSTYGTKTALADFDLVNQPPGWTGVPLAPYKRWQT